MKLIAYLLLATSIPLALTESQSVQAATTFVVNSTGDGPDAALNGVCQTATAGECTLRAALTEARAITSQHVTINFNIPGSGVRVIHVSSALPAVDNGTAGITVDGFSQPGSHVNTDALIDNAVRLVEVVGDGPSKHDGFVLTGSANVLRGLVVRTFRHAVVISGSAATFNHVVGSIIGLQANGAMEPNQRRLIGSACITINSGANRNRIGMPGNDNRNVISGCPESAVNMEQEFTWKNFVQNNILGLDPTGTSARPSDFGVDINWAANGNIVGGTGNQERNVISGNHYGGLEISHGIGTVGNSVVGNFIGTDPTGTKATAATANGETGIRIEGVPNCQNAPCAPDVSQTTITDNVVVNSGEGGVLIDKGTHDSTVARNRIGVTLNGTVVGNNAFGVRLAAGAQGITIGPDNIIAGSQHGIDITPLSVQPVGTVPTVTQRNTITANSVSATGMGIDLWPFDVVNTSSSADPKVNEGVLPPALLMQGTAIRASTCASCTVELFSAPGAGPSGPGVAMLGTAVAGSDGNAMFAMPGGGWDGAVTATTRTPSGSTSEFAVNLVPSDSGSSAFVAAGPTRIMDTRDGTGVPAGLRARGSSTDLHIDVPADATAVVLNVTITESIAAGYVQVFPTGGGVPGASSNLNVPGPDATIANLVIVPLGANDSVTLYSHAGGHLVADLFGYFAPAESSAAGRFEALQAPDRVLDTRDPARVPVDNPGDARDCADFATWADANAWFWTYRRHGDPAGLDADGNEIPCEMLPGNIGQRTVPADLFKLGQGGQYRLPVLTSAMPAGGVVPPGATAVVMNVTAVEPAAPGFVQVFNDPAMKGKSSNLNFTANDIAPNLVIVPIGPDGSVTIYAHSATHVVVDVIGYFTGANSPTSAAGLYVPFTPRRLIDTRDHNEPLPIQGQRDVALAALLGVDPGAVGAAFMNVTLVDSLQAGYLQVFPTGRSTPGASSSVNVTAAGQIRPTAVITAHNGGQVTVFDHAGGHFIFDAAGYFTSGAT